MFVEYNANPKGKKVNDCTVRAISTLLNKSWDEVYCSLCKYGRYFADMPSSNRVWSQYLLDNGYKRHMIPDTCPLCYTVRQFAEEHKKGRYLLALNGHVVMCEAGNFYDTFDSSDQTVLYYWEKEE